MTKAVMKKISLPRLSMLDMVFRDRNHAYGAYELRLHYPQRLQKAFGWTIAVVLAAAAILLLTAHAPRHLLPPFLPPAVQLSAVEETPPAIPPPPLPKPPAALTSRAPLPYNTFQVVRDPEVTPAEAPPDIDQIKTSAIGSVSGKGDVLDAGLLAPSGASGAGKGSAADKPFIAVEQMPRFPGSATNEESIRHIMAFLSAGIHYPAAARESGIEGTVVVRFVVGADGVISQAQVIGSDPGGGLAEEALRVVRSMPKWIPGRQNGRNVPVWFTLPVRFALR